MDGNVEDMCNAKCGRRRHKMEEQWTIVVEGATKVMNTFKQELHVLKLKHKDIIESKVEIRECPMFKDQTITIMELEEE